jgi:hypothetical protein
VQFRALEAVNFIGDAAISSFVILNTVEVTQFRVCCFSAGTRGRTKPDSAHQHRLKLLPPQQPFNEPYQPRHHCYPTSTLLPPATTSPATASPRQCQRTLRTPSPDFQPHCCWPYSKPSATTSPLAFRCTHRIHAMSSTPCARGGTTLFAQRVLCGTRFIFERALARPIRHTLSSPSSISASDSAAQTR